MSENDVAVVNRAMNPCRPGTNARKGVWSLASEPQIYLPIKNDKEGKVLAEIARLRDVFNDIPQDRKSLAEKAIQRAAWLVVSLEELEQCIDRAGFISEYQNGENQWGTKKNPDVETHNSMSQRFTQVMDYLYKMLPDKPAVCIPGSTIKDFIRNRPAVAPK